MMPVRLFHSEDDIEGPITNTYFTLQQFQQNGAPDVQLETVTGYSHPEAAIPWILSARTFMLSLRNNCVTGIPIIALNGNFSIYPNPATNKLFIKVNDATAVSGTVWIYSANGNILFSRFSNSLTNVELDISNIGNGTYLLGIERSNGVKSFRLFVVAN